MEIICDENGNEKERIHLDPTVGNYGCVVPQGAWHTVEVLEPSVIYEAKDGKYGEDGSETFVAFKSKEVENKEQASATFSNSLGDLKKNIEYLIGMERQSGSMDVITPLYVSRMLNVPLEEVEKVMREAQFWILNVELSPLAMLNYALCAMLSVVIGFALGYN